MSGQRKERLDLLIRAQAALEDTGDLTDKDRRFLVEDIQAEIDLMKLEESSGNIPRPVEPTCFHTIKNAKDDRGYAIKDGRYALYPDSLTLYTAPVPVLGAAVTPEEEKWILELIRRLQRHRAVDDKELADALLRLSSKLARAAPDAPVISADAIQLFRQEFQNEPNFPKRRQLLALCEQALRAHRVPSINRELFDLCEEALRALHEDDFPALRARMRLAVNDAQTLGA